MEKYLCIYQSELAQLEINLQDKFEQFILYNGIIQANSIIN